jgi:hypothetical protein
VDGADIHHFLITSLKHKLKITGIQNIRFGSNRLFYNQPLRPSGSEPVFTLKTAVFKTTAPKSDIWKLSHIIPEKPILFNQKRLFYSKVRLLPPRRLFPASGQGPRPAASQANPADTPASTGDDRIRGGCTGIGPGETPRRSPA